MRDLVCRADNEFFLATKRRKFSRRILRKGIKSGVFNVKVLQAQGYTLKEVEIAHKRCKGKFGWVFGSHLFFGVALTNTFVELTEKEKALGKFRYGKMIVGYC